MTAVGKPFRVDCLRFMLAWKLLRTTNPHYFPHDEIAGYWGSQSGVLTMTLSGIGLQLQDSIAAVGVQGPSEVWTGRGGTSRESDWKGKGRTILEVINKCLLRSDTSR